MKGSVLKKFDIWIPILLTAIFIIGIVLLQSSCSISPLPLADKTFRQLCFFFIGIAVFVIFAVCDYDAIGRLAYPIAFVNIAILVIVLVAGHSEKGAQRWLSIGGLMFQPSEPTKLIVILALARILANIQKLDRQTLYSITFTVAVPWFLIFVQPDLGTSLVILFAAFVLLYLYGVKPWILFSVICSGSLIGSLFLKDYQKARLTVFMNPESDLTGTGWNIAQSKIAIGSGGLWGKGIFGGTQTQLGFVPENHTDFIFSVAGEELGFAGCIAMLVLYALLMWRFLVIIKSAKDRFGFFTGAGIFALIGFHIFVNMGMVMGIMPVVGIPLPFVSYGGSAFISNMAALGIMESIYSRREMLFYH
ncbi:MAG: rod shape-determining protein RodA [bacterium]|nr:rod shape-determining protein RodA [bacterium]